MTPKNAEVNIINDFVLEKFVGEESVYFSADCASNEERQLQFPPEFLNSIEFGGLPPHKLKLKIGCPVMLLRNLSPSSGLCNGTRLIVKSLLPNVIEAMIATGSKVGSVVLLPKIKLFSPDESPVAFRRHQFPVRAAFAMTVNKAQGQTHDRVGLYLPSPVFCRGQLYVALSRVKSPHSIKILTDENENDIPKNYTRNVVYKELFTTQ
jgi:ATP-dependent DNA helicase PIF1